jgi:hypothetical protein
LTSGQSSFGEIIDALPSAAEAISGYAMDNAT